MKKRLLYHIRSFGFALNGLKVLLLGERNMLIHLLATLAVIALGLWFRLSTERWCLLLFAIAGVWVAEAFNTAIERLCNVVSPDRHPIIKQVKDISAAAVLLTAIAAVLTGILVFFF